MKTRNFMRFAPSSLALLICIFIAINAAAQQLKFEKTSFGNGSNFYYAFQDVHQEQHEASLQLSTLTIDQSKELIPKLGVLRQKFQEEVPYLAQNIAQDLLVKLNDHYNEHRAALYHSLENQQLPQGLSIEIDCPVVAVEFFLETPKTAQSTFGQRIALQSCQFQTKNKDAFAHLMEQIKAVHNSIQDQLPKETLYKIAIDYEKRSYRFQSKIQGKSNAEVNKIAALIKTNQNQIKQIQDKFQTDQQKLGAIFNQLVKEHRSYMSKLRPQVNKVFNRIFHQIEAENHQFYQQHFLSTEKKGNSLLVYPDYQRIAEHYAYDMQPLASSFARQKSERETIQTILNFFQSIPYNELEGRDIVGLSGFLTPVSMIDQNKGDCDSKSVAMLSLLKSILPQTKKLMVLINRHAFVAIKTLKNDGDSTITHQGEEYVVAEVAGPAILPLGQAGKATLRAINTNRIEKIIEF